MLCIGWRREEYQRYEGYIDDFFGWDLFPACINLRGMVI